MDPKSTVSGGDGNGSRAEPGNVAVRSEHLTDEAVQKMREQAERMGERLTEAIRERPLLAILIALSAGILVGRMVRL